MATQQKANADSTFHTLLGRALSDVGFRDRLMGPDQTARQQAFKEVLERDPTTEEMQALNAAIDPLMEFEGLFGGIRPCS